MRKNPREASAEGKSWLFLGSQPGWNLEEGGESMWERALGFRPG